MTRKARLLGAGAIACATALGIGSRNGQAQSAVSLDSVTLAPAAAKRAYEALTKVLGPQPPMAPARPFGGVGNEPPQATPPQPPAR